MSALPHTIAGTVAKLIALLSSSQDGEVLGAVAAIRRTLAAEKLDLHDLAHLVAGSPSSTRGNGLDPIAAAQFCLDSGIPYDDREVKFLLNVPRLVRRGLPLTPKQAAWLHDLHLRAARRAAA
jgi:hypothetical protein